MWSCGGGADDAAGAVVERFAYTPFGVADSNVGSPWRFTGRRLDRNTGLYYLFSTEASLELAPRR